MMVEIFVDWCFEIYARAQVRNVGSSKYVLGSRKCLESKYLPS